MLAAFWRTLVKIVVASQRQNLCHDLFTIWKNTDSDLKVHTLHYANELLVRFRLAFQKLLQTSQTSRNNKKLSKTGFGYDKALFGKLTNLSNIFSANYQIHSYVTRHEMTQTVTFKVNQLHLAITGLGLSRSKNME